MIESWQIRETLRTRLGSSLVDEPGFCDPLSALLNSYASYKESFADLFQKVENTLFNMLYNHLGPSMSVRMNDGTFRRVHTSELKDAADDVLGVLFEKLKVYSVSYEALHTYMMESGSFSAMRVLYTRYRDFLSPEEQHLLERFIREARPRSEWADWISPEDG